MVVSPPAVRGHDPLVAVEQFSGAVLVTVSSDPIDRGLLSERAPQRSPPALEPPTGLIHIDTSRAPERPDQFQVRQLERVRGAGQNLIDAADRDPGAEQ